MSKPSGSIKNIKTPDNTSHEIIPDRLGNGSYVAGLPTMTKDDTFALLGKANTFTEKQTFSSTTASSFTVSPTTNESISGSANNSKLVPSSWVRTNFQTKLPTTTTAGKVLKSTSTAGSVEWGDAGGSITIDSSLSTTSENPVQNKVITGALNDREETSNKTTSISSSSTDTQYPSAKLLYDELQYKLARISYKDAYQWSIADKSGIDALVWTASRDCFVLIRGSSNVIDSYYIRAKESSSGGTAYQYKAEYGSCVFIMKKGDKLMHEGRTNLTINWCDLYVIPMDSRQDM